MPFDGTSKPSVRFASQSVLVLELVERFFDGGTNWTRRTYRTDDGKCCLLGAIEYVRCKIGFDNDSAVEYLARAINLRQARRRLPPLGDCVQNTVIGFNDAFSRSFSDIATSLRDAKELAAIDADVQLNRHAGERTFAVIE